MVETIQRIPISKLVVGYNPRKSLGFLTELKASIKENGLLVPLLVRPVESKFEVVSGQRRFSCCKQLKFEKILCVVRSISDEEAHNISFIDNKERNNLNPVEEAEHFEYMKEKHGYSTRVLAQKYGGNYRVYSYKLELLNLPEEIKKQLVNSSSQLPETHCRHVCKLLNKDGLEKKFVALYGSKETWTDKQKERVEQEIKTRQEIQINFAKRIVESEMSVKQAEKNATKLMEEIKERDNGLDKEIEKKKELESLLDGIYFKDASDMKEIETNTIHLIVTSPPYFAGKEYESTDFGEYLKNVNSVLSECTRVLVSGGKLVLNVGDILQWGTQNGDLVEEKMLMPLFVETLKKKNLNLFARIIWKKDDPWHNNPHVHMQKHGDYRVLPNWEYVFVFKNMNGKPSNRKQSEENESKLSKEDWKKSVSAVWDIKSVRKNDLHPAVFPDELVERIVKMYSFVGDIVLDPFLGSGTTVRVARKLNRVGYGYEVNEKYKESILKKLGEENG